MGIPHLSSPCAHIAHPAWARGRFYQEIQFNVLALTQSPKQLGTKISEGLTPPLSKISYRCSNWDVLTFRSNKAFSVLAPMPAPLSQTLLWCWPGHPSGGYILQVPRSNVLMRLCWLAGTFVVKAVISNVVAFSFGFSFLIVLIFMLLLITATLLRGKKDGI